MRIAQAITNLLNNSAKYTDAGGRIEVTARREGSNAVIAVRDNGRGISPDMLPRVFDLFAQASPGADQARGGLGIGLTLVRSLVEMHGGGVEARSAGLGRGSEFIVRLPLSGVAEGALPHPPGTGGLASSHRVLVVDENRDAADSLGVLLTLLGAETRSATDGGAALEALDGFRPTAILIDVCMRWMDVFEIARRVRAHAQGRQAALIALVARGEKRDDKRSRECGIDHHLSKPVDLEELRKLFAELPYVPDNGAAGTMAAAR
jgi:CheY-like chemotaxis protein